MLKIVHLENFRGFQKLSLDLAPVSVVVGRNSSGKTTVLHAISAAHRAYAQVLDDPDAKPIVRGKLVRVCDGAILQGHSWLLPLAVQEEIFRNAEVHEGVETVIDLHFDRSDPVRQLVVRLSYMRNQVLKLTVDVDCPAAFAAVKDMPAKSKYRPMALANALRRDLPVAVLVPAFYGVMLEEEFRSAPLVDEHLQEGQQSRIVRNLVARLSASDLEQLNAFLQRTVGAQIVSRTASADSEKVHPLMVRFRDTNGPLDLSSAGAGVVNLISLFAALKWRQRAGRGTTCFLLDEPEAHLHPRLQGELGHELAELVRSFENAQFVAATHSVEMINRLGRRDDAILISVDRVSSTSVALRSEVAMVDELSRWADLTPFMSLNFLASRKLLFHEGPSDARILQRAAEVLFRNKPDAMAAFKRWTLVLLEGTGHAPGVAALRKVIAPKVFPSLATGAAPHLVLVLDKDYSRAPAFESKSVAGVQSTEVVWSRHSIESLFLDAKVLGQWLAAAVPSTITTVNKFSEIVEEGIQVADVDAELIDYAVAQLTPIKMREGARPESAVKAAQKDVRDAPAVWQHGRKRAHKVLEVVRDKLSTKERTHVRASIGDLLDAANLDRLSDPDSAIPPEIRLLLENMVG